MSRPSLVRAIVSPIERFLNLQAAGGVVLLAAALLALICANTSLKQMYFDLLHLSVGVQWGGFSLAMSLHHWVNDGLMVIFFFLVGLEIKSEMVNGSLSSKKEAVLPLMAALGGMIIPALVYIVLNHSQETIAGWGIPMATDIAFAVGILAFLSGRAPLSLKIFLLALATIDDLGAVLVIASVYSSDISWFWISMSCLTVLFIFCLKQLRVQSYWFYAAAGAVLWFVILKSGVHATIAGVILGLMTPARPYSDLSCDKEKETDLPPDKAVSELVSQKLEKPEAPVQFLIDRLHHFVSFFVMPVFAFFNSGLDFKGGISITDLQENSVAQGIFLGLVLGKPAGIFLFSWVSVHFRFAQWPAGAGPAHILGVGCLAGIGFTMALFISGLSLGYDTMLENYAKASIFLASLISGVFGFMILYFFSGKNKG